MSTSQSISSSGTISFSGLATGIDTSSIVSQLMALERAPEKILTDQKTKMQGQASEYTKLSSLLKTLQSTLTAMNTVGTFAAKRVSVADGTVASATATASALAATHTLKVTSLAQSQTLVSNSGYASDTALNFGTGTVTITNAADPTHPVTINIDGTKNSLQGIASAINSSGANVSASVVNDGSGTPYRLAIIGKDTNTYSVTASLTGGSTGYDAPVFTEKVAASNAVFQVDGIDMTRTANTVTDAIPGVTLNLLNTNDPSRTTITVTNDTSSVTDKINSFITAYNNVMNLINQDTAYDSTKNTAGPLFGDSTVRTVRDTLQTVLTSAVSGLTGSYTSLSQIGINSEAKTGILSINADSTQGPTLSDALSRDFNGVVSLFTSNTGTYGFDLDQYGIAEQFNQQITALTKPYLAGSYSGIIAARVQGLNDNMTDIDDRIAAMEVRLTAMENSLNAQFTAMETTISNTQAWGNQLLAAFGINSYSTSSSK